MQSGRGLQGMRDISGGGHAGTEHADRRRDCHLRHGRSHPPANVAIHPAVRQEDSRSASGSDAIEDKKPTCYKPTIRVQHGVCSVQAIPTGEVEE